MIKNAVGNPKLKAETFKSRFLEAGVVEYQDGRALIKPENLMTIALKFKGAKVIIDHKDVTAENAHEIIGYINNVWKEEDGCAWCDFAVSDAEAIELINKGYSVSCAYLPVVSGSGGTKNAVSYDKEIIDLVEDDEVTHLAIVENPRYEDAIILKNSIKSKVMNIFKFKKPEVKENSVVTEIPENSYLGLSEEFGDISMQDAIQICENALKNTQEEEKKVKANESDEYEVGGKMMKVSEMKKIVEASMKKNAEDEDEKKKNAEEEDGKKKKEDEEKKKEAKKNSEDAIALKNAKEAFDKGESVKNSKIITDSQRFTAGATAWGEPQKINN